MTMYKYYDLGQLGIGRRVKIEGACDRNKVFLLTEKNFEHYKNHMSHMRHVSWKMKNSNIARIPQDGHWYVVSEDGELDVKVIESRIIKSYGYVEKFDDVIDATADGIFGIAIPSISLHISKNFQEGELILCFQADAEEEVKGVTVTTTAAVPSHSWGKDNMRFYEQICYHKTQTVMDENEFVDIVFDAIMNNNDKISADKISKPCAKQFIEEHIFPNRYWFKNGDEWINYFSPSTALTLK